MNKELFVTAAIIAAVAGLLAVAGCAPKQVQQQQQTATQVLPQDAQAQEAATPPELQQPPEKAEPLQAAAAEDDLYRDNLDGAVDDLSQLEQ